MSTSVEDGVSSGPTIGLSESTTVIFWQNNDTAFDNFNYLQFSQRLCFSFCENSFIDNIMVLWGSVKTNQSFHACSN